MKEYLNGNEAVARGIYEGGALLATSYPGTPTSTTIQTIGNKYKEIYSEYSQNEAVAAQLAIGGSIMGARVMFNAKQVGLNVALDAIMTFTESNINGGFLAFIADDPGLTSSSNEQDSRVLGKFANMGILSASNQQELKDYAKLSFELSENFDLPIMLRTTTRLCGSYSNVETKERLDVPIKPYVKNLSKYCMFPPYANKAQYKMKNAVAKLEEYAYDTTLNKLEIYEGNNTLIVTSDYMYALIKELNPPASILKLGMIYPISTKRIQELGKIYDKIVVCEELLPFIEDEIKLKGVHCKGKEYFSFTGQLSIEDVARGLIKANILQTQCNISTNIYDTKCDKISEIPCMNLNDTSIETENRSPLFYSGCPHRPIFNILKDLDALIVGDIGCYTMGMYFPWFTNEINMNMGTSVGIAKGISKILKKKEDNKPIIALIGDGTFYHSGILSILNLLQNQSEDDNITIIILNNGTIALTDWESNLGTGNYAKCKQPNSAKGYFNICGDNCLKPECMLQSFGFNDIEVIDQFEVNKTKEVITNCISRKGIKFIIAIRPCIIAFNVQKPTFKVDENKCIGCRKCTKLACEPIRMKEYDNQPIKKAFIDEVLCTGCSVCAQICPVGAIKQCE